MNKTLQHLNTKAVHMKLPVSNCPLKIFTFSFLLAKCQELYNKKIVQKLPLAVAAKDFPSALASWTLSKLLCPTGVVTTKLSSLLDITLRRLLLSGKLMSVDLLSLLQSFEIGMHCSFSD